MISPAVKNAQVIDFNRASVLREARRLRAQFREAAIEIFRSNALDGFVASLEASFTEAEWAELQNGLDLVWDEKQNEHLAYSWELLDQSIAILEKRDQ